MFGRGDRLWSQERQDPGSGGLPSPRRNNGQPGPNAHSLGTERKELSLKPFLG